MAHIVAEPKQKPQRRGIDWLVDRHVRKGERQPVKAVYPGNGASKVPCIDPRDRSGQVVN